MEKDIYLYKKALCCHECVSRECSEDKNNNLNIEHYFKDKYQCTVIVESQLRYHKEKYKNCIKMYNKTKNRIYWLDKDYWERKIKEWSLLE